MEKYEQIVRKVEQARRCKAEADGALQHAKQQLQEFGCSTLQEATQLLGEMEQSVRNLEEKFETECRKFEEKWNEAER